MQHGVYLFRHHVAHNFADDIGPDKPLNSVASAYFGRYGGFPHTRRSTDKNDDRLLQTAELPACKIVFFQASVAVTVTFTAETFAQFLAVDFPYSLFLELLLNFLDNLVNTFNGKPGGGQRSGKDPP